MKINAFSNYFFIIIFLIFFSACQSKQPILTNFNIKIALIGNTYPESPFKSFPEKKINTIISKLNNENPVFIIHMGNTIYGGNQDMGLRDTDINNQFSVLRNIFKSCKFPKYVVIGEKDLYNNSPNLCVKYAKQKSSYYSFNYANIHFIILDTFNPIRGEISDKQIKWLKNDLTLHKNFNGIYIFSHLPFFKSKNQNHKKLKNLHNLFIHFPVKAVFSTTNNYFHSFKKDNITYINLKINELHKNLNNKNNYYIANFTPEQVRIIGKK